MTALQTIVVIFGLLNLPFAFFLYMHSDRRLATLFYAFISIFASLWSISTFLTVVPLPDNILHDALYGHYIFGYLAYLAFFWFSLYFPSAPRRIWELYIASAITIASIGLLASIPLSDSVFSYAPSGTSLSSHIVFNTSGYKIFILALSTIFFLGLGLLIWKRRTVSARSVPGLEENQISFALLSNLVAGVLGIVLNLVLPLYGDFAFFYINPVFVTCALIGIGFYNLLHFNLFQAKVVLTEFFAAGIWILFLIKLVSSVGEAAFGTNLVVFAGAVFFGIFLIDSVLREVRLRERTETLARALAVTNARQETLIHFIGHEVKGFLTKAEGVFAALLEGDFGQLPPVLEPFVREALSQTREGVTSVSNILKAANQKKGTVSYKKEKFDVKQLVIEAVDNARGAAEEKKLALTLHLNEQLDYPFVGDKEQFEEHVLRNLIDNAINYTPAGAIDVTIEKQGGKLVLSVKDTGVGITEEDKAHLFTEGGHGKESQKVNVHSTGYGLFIAKNVIEAEGGTIRAESEGPGKGSTFIVELPARSATVGVSPG